jgi:hypothetical protein|tara:strand:+ start:409 stop:594 length:186 start_codon:yes stop_codon:yes gene_type:complete
MSQLFTEALESLPQFVSEMNPDWEMVYDYMTEQMSVDNLTPEQILKVTDVYDEFMGYNDGQ